MTISCNIPPTVRGVLCVLGGFIIQLVVGSFHGTFGNILPYLTSYRRQADPTLTNGDLAVLLPGAGITQGLVSFMVGIFFVPMFGPKPCLIFGATAYTAGPLLAYLVLDMPIPFLTVSLGCLAGVGMNCVFIPVMVTSVSWFPNKKGTVVGVIAAGFGLAATVFTPLQTLIINPDNVLPVLNNNSNSTEVYFQDPDVLARVPIYLLYIGVVYAIMAFIAIILVVPNPNSSQNEKVKETKIDAIKKSLDFLWHKAFTNRDFYLLWLTRYTMLVICGGLLSHWKTFGLQLGVDDRQISIIGGLNGIVNSVSRIVIGMLLDRFAFRILMPSVSAILCAILVSIFWVGNAVIEGYYVLILMAYWFSFAHFATVPSQAVRLFKDKGSLIFGAVGLSDTVAYVTVTIINIICFSEEQPKFVPFFICLSVFAFLCALITAFVREPSTSNSSQDDMEMKGDVEINKDSEAYENSAYIRHNQKPVISINHDQKSILEQNSRAIL